MGELDHAERLARIETHLEHISARLEEMVSKSEFYLVRVITYGMAGGILIAFLSSVIVKVMGAA